MNDISIYADAKRLEMCIDACQYYLRPHIADTHTLYRTLVGDLSAVLKRVKEPTADSWGVTLSVTEGFLLIAALSKAGTGNDLRAEILNAIGKAISDEQRRLD